jgi:hypothetical protein
MFNYHRFIKETNFFNNVGVVVITAPFLCPESLSYRRGTQKGEQKTRSKKKSPLKRGLSQYCFKTAVVFKLSGCNGRLCWCKYRFRCRFCLTPLAFIMLVKDILHKTSFVKLFPVWQTA